MNLFINKTSLLCVISLIFMCQIFFVSDAESNDALVNKLLESSRELYEFERNLISEIDATRYKSINTELSPIENSLFLDVIYLLEWALEIDHANFHASYLLGKIYQQKSELSEGFVDKKYNDLCVKYLSSAKKLFFKLENGNKELIVDINNRLNEITDLSKEAIIDGD